MQEARKYNILCRLTVQLHPLRDNTRENRDTQGVVVDITRQMIDLVQIVNRPTAARERQEIRLHQLIRLSDGHIPRLFRLLKDRLRRPNHILILLDKEIAAREDRRSILLELRLILDVDNGNLQELEARDMRRCQLRILRHDNHTFGIDDRPRKYHPIFQITYGYCTQGKPSLDLSPLHLRTKLLHL